MKCLFRAVTKLSTKQKFTQVDELPEMFMQGHSRSKLEKQTV